MPPSADLMLKNLRLPSGGNALAIAGGRIIGVGRRSDLAPLAGPNTETLDCAGRAVAPALSDAHCHIFAAAAAQNGVDCRPTATPGVAAVIKALQTAAVMTPKGGWLRGYGYDHSPVGLGRHLNRADLDAVSRRRPVRVEHRSGHACVLNTAALRAAGIDRHTPDPPGAVIARDAAGEPTGLLLEMSGWLRRRIGGSADTAHFHASLRQFGQRLLSYGIAAATDAGPHNGIARWQAFVDAIDAGLLSQRITMMAGVDRLPELAAAGLRYGAAACAGMLRLGHAKIMLTASAGALHPHPAALAEMVQTARNAGYPVAVHAVERDAIVAAALTLADNPPPPGSRHRIEHCAECPPDVAELVRQSGARAVLNPAFLHYDGERYRATVPPDMLSHLYPAGALAAMGIPLSFGSDAPAVEPNPWAALSAAATRQSAKGASLGGTGLPSVADALRIHTAGQHIAPGQPADLAVLNASPLTTPLADLPATRATVIINGRIVHRDDI